jgi:hypothetical protein
VCDPFDKTADYKTCDNPQEAPHRKTLLIISSIKRVCR